MANLPRPKVLLFDMGGVCVLSPFKKIQEFEDERGIPRGYINYSIARLTPNGSWHKLERGEIKCDADYFRSFKADLEREDFWRDFHQKRGLPSKSPVPPVPEIDSEKLFWSMMGSWIGPDPYMYPALQRLQASGLFHLAGLSNTTIFPEGHELSRAEGRHEEVKRIFGVFVSSAHVGMRKPSRDIYEYTMRLLREKWGDDITPGDVCFLDDIGENLKTARSMGMRTIRVYLGRVDDAVRELEQVTGLSLLDEHQSPGKAKL